MEEKRLGPAPGDAPVPRPGRQAPFRLEFDTYRLDPDDERLMQLPSEHTPQPTPFADTHLTWEVLK